jgi:DNA-binding FadR family transcriptional regulator
VTVAEREAPGKVMSPKAREDALKRIGGMAVGAAGLSGVGDELKSDRVAAQLERRILSGQLVPGDRLPTEGELGEILGVSRSVVRDAIRILSARGRVTVRQGRGMTVAEPSDAAFGLALIALLARSDLTMGEVIDARAVIETRLVPLAVEGGLQEDLDHLEEVYGGFAEAVREHDWDAARDNHLAFHVGLVRALHQPALELLLRPLTEVILISSEPPRLTAPEDWEVETHWPILAALEDRDAAAVERAVAEHYAVIREPARYGEFRARPFREVFAHAPVAGS